MYCKILKEVKYVMYEVLKNAYERISAIVQGIQQGHQRSRIILSITQGDHVLKGHISNQV